MSERLAVLRADATPNIGVGHLSRCRALAQGLDAAGWRCRFAVSRETAATVGAPAGAIVLPNEAGREPVALRQAEPGGCALLVVDHYERHVDFERACRIWARRVLVIDDLLDRQHDADLLLDPNTTGERNRHLTRVPSGTTILAGSQFALLDPRFAAARAAALARRRESVAARRVLVSPGGMDRSNVAGAALGAIAALDADLLVDVALMPDAPHLPALRARAGPNVTFHVPAIDMPKLMAEADIAIGAAGVSAWERCCLGLPALIVMTAANQRRNADALTAAGAAIAVGCAGSVDPRDMQAALRSVLASRSLRESMSAAASVLCDGRGVERVVSALDAMFS